MMSGSYRANLGEGPAWDARFHELVSVDILSGVVYVHDAQGIRQKSYDVGVHIGSVLPAEEGGWLLACADGFKFLERNGSMQKLLSIDAYRTDLRFNDAKCDPTGQALAGTMRYDEKPGDGSLYRLAADPNDGEGEASGLKAVMLLEHVGLSNGLGWNADGDVLYFVDSLAQNIVRFPYAPDLERLSHGQVVVEIPASLGVPDGLCVDDMGYLWLALYGGGAVHRYTPDGVLHTIVTLPVPHVTSVAFGGSRGDRLFITTAGGDGTPRGDGVGGLWAIDPGVSAEPATLWRRPSTLPDH